MSYRQSNFDPNAFEARGRPLRPFNWVQWTGVVLVAVGGVAFLLHFAGLFGWIQPVIRNGVAAYVPMILGAALINSRREPGTMVGSEQLARNRRMLVITTAICALVLGAAALIQFTGA